MRKIVYRTQLFDDTGKFLTCCGSPTQPEYSVKINEKTGAVDYMPNGEVTNMQDMINASYASVEIHELMKRFQMGDVDVFNQRQGFYGDVTEMPKNMAEMFQRVNDCKDHFDSLPVEVKEEFNNSYTEYFSMMNDNPRMFNQKLSELDMKLNPIDIPDMPDVKSGEGVSEKGDVNNA